MLRINKGKQKEHVTEPNKKSAARTKEQEATSNDRKKPITDICVRLEPGSNVTDARLEDSLNALLPIVSTLAGKEMATSATQS